MIITCAGEGRLPHSHYDGRELRNDEHYENVAPDEMRDAMESAGVRVLIATTLGNDTQAIGIN